MLPSKQNILDLKNLLSTRASPQTIYPEHSPQTIKPQELLKLKSAIEPGKKIIQLL
jgi:hypothetical protein